MRLTTGRIIRKPTWEGILDFVARNVPDRYIASMLAMTTKEFRTELRENSSFRLEIDRARAQTYLGFRSEWDTLKSTADDKTKANMLMWEAPNLHGIKGRENFSLNDSEDENKEIGGKFILEVSDNGKN